MNSPSLGYTGRQVRLQTPVRRSPYRNTRNIKLYRSGNGQTNDQEKRIAEELQKSGLTPSRAKEIMESWQDEVGHELTPEDLRKILVGQSQKALALVIFSTVLDAGAAYGAFAAGGFLGLASEDYGVAAIVGQAIAYLLAGYYLTGVIFDAFKIVTVAIASIQFNVNSAAFLNAVESISKSGLNIADKANEAVNSVKVAQAMKKIVALMQEEEEMSSTRSVDMLSDLGAYLTLAKAESMQNFDASEFGLTEKEAGDIASIFSRFDLNDDGVINRDEFKKLCAEYSPEIQSDEDISYALTMIDTNADGTIDLQEFVRWWQGKFSE